MSKIKRYEMKFEWDDAEEGYYRGLEYYTETGGVKVIQLEGETDEQFLVRVDKMKNWMLNKERRSQIGLPRLLNEKYYGIQRRNTKRN